jgi:hypothetical protein
MAADCRSAHVSSSLTPGSYTLASKLFSFFYGFYEYVIAIDKSQEVHLD